MVVAVKRLSEEDATWRFKEFETEMEAICRVQHCNIVRLRAYYQASDEKLLVYNFICNGSLYNALHEDRLEAALASTLELMKMKAKLLTNKSDTNVLWKQIDARCQSRRS
ncbi:unnamed protein product [Fraxinus pennsylvanica]|uniref:Serine-threonine/tyrosine-protein kinase catalytic domain-containing protein n=1 Tax=Fraxinus pennsylvanica TaxID=56036 RepID=A0AAD2DJM3_9LAMI|nr:unnamed protein product [Fraxinus pennsylvanica]